VVTSAGEASVKSLPHQPELSYNLLKADAGRGKALYSGGVPGTGLHRGAVVLIPQCEATYFGEL